MKKSEFKVGDLVRDLAPADYGIGVITEVEEWTLMDGDATYYHVGFDRFPEDGAYTFRTSDQLRKLSKLEQSLA